MKMFTLNLINIITIFSLSLFFYSCKSEGPAEGGEKKIVNDIVPDITPEPAPVAASFSIDNLSFTHYSASIMNSNQTVSGTCTEDKEYTLEIEHGGSTDQVTINCLYNVWNETIDFSLFSNGTVKLISSNSIEFTKVEQVITSSVSNVSFVHLNMMFSDNAGPVDSPAVRDYPQVTPVIPQLQFVVPTNFLGNANIPALPSDRSNLVLIDETQHQEHKILLQTASFNFEAGFTVDSCSTNGQVGLSEVTGSNCSEFTLSSEILNSATITFSFSQNGNVVGYKNVEILTNHDGPMKITTANIGSIYREAVLDENRIAVRGNDHKIHIINTSTKEITRYPAAMERVGSDSMNVVDGKIFFGGMIGAGANMGLGKLFVLDPDNSTITQVTDIFSGGDDPIKQENTIVFESKLYFSIYTTSNMDGRAGLYSVDTNNVVTKLSNYTQLRKPLVFNNKIYFIGQDNKLYTYDPVNMMQKISRFDVDAQKTFKVIKDESSGKELLVFTTFDMMDGYAMSTIDINDNIQRIGQVERTPFFNQPVALMNDQLHTLVGNVLWVYETEGGLVKWEAKFDFSGFAHNSEISKLISFNGSMFLHIGKYILEVDENYNITTKLELRDGEDATIYNHVVMGDKLILNMSNDSSRRLIAFE